MSDGRRARLAEAADLPALQAMYRGIVAHMRAQGLEIWDDVYPCGFLGEDVAARQLYVLTEAGEIVAAFALSERAAGRMDSDWPLGDVRAMVLDRLGVNVCFQRRGVGARALDAAAQIARERGARALRLFVVEENAPAIRLYERQGFVRKAGVHLEEIDAELTLREYGYERKLF